MATCKTKTETKTTITLELSVEEATALDAVLTRVSTAGKGGELVNAIWNALNDEGIDSWEQYSVRCDGSTIRLFEEPAPDECIEPEDFTVIVIGDDAENDDDVEDGGCYLEDY